MVWTHTVVAAAPSPTWCARVCARARAPTCARTRARARACARTRTRGLGGGSATTRRGDKGDAVDAGPRRVARAHGRPRAAVRHRRPAARARAPQTICMYIIYIYIICITFADNLRRLRASGAEVWGAGRARDPQVHARGPRRPRLPPQKGQPPPPPLSLARSIAPSLPPSLPLSLPPVLPTPPPPPTLSLALDLALALSPSLSPPPPPFSLSLFVCARA